MILDIKVRFWHFFTLTMEKPTKRIGWSVFSFSRSLSIKAELPQVSIFFALGLFAREILLIKQLEIEKTKTSQHTPFKTDIMNVVLVFSISNYFY